MTQTIRIQTRWSFLISGFLLAIVMMATPAASDEPSLPAANSAPKYVALGLSAQQYLSWLVGDEAIVAWYGDVASELDDAFQANETLKRNWKGGVRAISLSHIDQLKPAAVVVASDIRLNNNAQAQTISLQPVERPMQVYEQAYKLAQQLKLTDAATVKKLAALRKDIQQLEMRLTTLSDEQPCVVVASRTRANRHPVLLGQASSLNASLYWAGAMNALQLDGQSTVYQPPIIQTEEDSEQNENAAPTLISDPLAQCVISADLGDQAIQLTELRPLVMGSENAPTDGPTATIITLPLLHLLSLTPNSIDTLTTLTLSLYPELN